MEMVLNNGFCEMSQEDMEMVDGGRNWLATIAGTICGVATIV